MSEVYERLKEYISVSAGITIAVLGFLVSKNDLVVMYHRSDTIKLSLSAALFVTSLIWFFSFYRSVRDELDIVSRTFDVARIQSFASIRGMLLPTGVILGILFAALISFSTNIFVYTIIAWFVLLVNLYGVSVTNRNIGIILLKRQFKGKKGEREGDILFRYYFERPQLLRIAVKLTVFACALMLAWTARLRQEVTYEYAAYVLSILTVLLGLAAIYHWRAVRDRELLQIAADDSPEDAADAS